MSIIKFAKTNSNAIIPSKRKEDAGYDIYACFSDAHIFLNPHETKIIPTGLKVAFDDNYVMILKERGSTGIRGIGLRSGVIDSGFRGEIKVVVTNHNDKPLIITTFDDVKDKDDCIIHPSSKAICQAVFVPIASPDIMEITENEIDNITSERKNGMFGSSDK